MLVREDINRILRLARREKTIVEVSNKIGVDYTTVYNYIYRHHVDIRRSLPRIGTVTKMEVIDFYKKNPNTTFTNISFEFGISRSSVVRILQKSGLYLKDKNGK